MRIKRFSLDPFKHVFFEGDGETAIVIRENANALTSVDVLLTDLEAYVQIDLVNSFGAIVGRFPNDSEYPELTITGKQILADPTKMLLPTNQPIRTELSISPKLLGTTDSIAKLKGNEESSTGVFEKFFSQSLGDLRIELAYFNSDLDPDVTVFDFGQIKIVDSYYFGINELRALDRLSDEEDYPNELLLNTRSSVEDFIDDFTLTNWTIKGDEFIYSDPNENLLPSDKNIKVVGIYTLNANGQPIIDGTVTSYDKTVSDIFLDRLGHIFLNRNAGAFNPHGYAVKYEWGEGIVPSDLSRAAKKYSEHILLNDPSVIPDRARMIQTAQGMLLLDVATMDKPTGLPEVDSIFLRRRRKEITTIA